MTDLTALRYGADGPPIAMPGPSTANNVGKAQFWVSLGSKWTVSTFHSSK